MEMWVENGRKGQDGRYSEERRNGLRYKQKTKER